MPLLELDILEMRSFTHYSPSCFAIWSCNFDFLFMNCSTNQVEWYSFGSIFEGVMPLSKLEYWKYTVFRTFLLHALIYWAEIWYITLKFLFINLRSSSSVVILRQFLYDLCSFSNLNDWKYTHFSSSYFDILSWNFAHDFLFFF